MKAVYTVLVAVGLGTLGVSSAEPALEISAQLESPLILSSTKHAHVLVRLRAERSEGKEEQQALNLALVVDRSGSMKGAKIADARAAAVNMLERMRDGDRVSVISYSDDVQVNAASTVLNEETRTQVRNAIHRISDGGYTNLGGGLIEGLAQVKKHRGDADVNRVLLISDGLANRGVQEPKELNRMSREALQEGIITTTIGLGEDYNEDLMTGVADHGGGNYYFVENSEGIVETLNDEIRQMASTVAKSVSLHVNLPEDVTVEKVHGWVPREEGEMVIVPLGEFFSGQLRSVLWKFALPEGLEPGDEIALGKVELAFKGVDEDGTLQRFASEPLTLTVTEQEDQVLAARNMEVAARVAEIELATRMEEAANLVADRKFEEAKTLLGRAVSSAQEAGAVLPQPVAEDLLAAAEAAEKMQEQVDAAESSTRARKVFTKGSKAEALILKKK